MTFTPFAVKQTISCYGLYILTKIQSMCDQATFFNWLVKQLAYLVWKE